MPTPLHNVGKDGTPITKYFHLQVKSWKKQAADHSVNVHDIFQNELKLPSQTTIVLVHLFMK